MNKTSQKAKFYTHLYSKSPMEKTFKASFSETQAPVELQGKECPLQVLEEKVSKK